MPSSEKRNIRSPAGLAKFSVPRSRTWVKRHRLFDLLDKALSHPLTWIGAQAGAGKTTLLASYLQEHSATVLWYNLEGNDGDPATFFYHLRRLVPALSPRHKLSLPLLTPDYLPAIETYATNFFREFFRAFANGGVVALDNVQDVNSQNDFLQLIGIAVREAPPNIAIVCLSRNVAPALYSRALLNGDMVQINREDLKWNNNEIIAMAESMSVAIPSAEDLVLLQTQTDGWAAGLALLLQEASRNHLQQPLGNTTEQTLFDYFNLEIFQRFTSAEQNFLLMTAFLPEITEELAIALTGEPQATKFLEKLIRKNYFTVQLSATPAAAYRYHPLFRNFLIQQAHELLPSKEITDIQTNAAELLADRQNHSAAVSLLVEAQQWQLLTDILCQTAQRYIAQGRHQSILDWLNKVPVTVLTENTWLLYWKAAALMPIDFDNSHSLFADAYQNFEQREDGHGMVMAWSGAVETIIHALSHTERLDYWIDQLPQLRKYAAIDSDPLQQAYIAPQIVAIYALRGKQDPGHESWLTVTRNLLTQPVDPTQRIMASFSLITYFHWSGQPARTEPVLQLQQAILQEGEAAPLAIIITKLCSAWFSWIYGRHEQCSKAIQEGLDVIERTGVQHWTFILLIQGITNALMQGRMAEAKKYFERLEPLQHYARDMDRAYFHNESAWMAILNGQPEQALRQQLSAVVFAESMGAPFVLSETYFGLSQAYHANGNETLARGYLNKAQDQAKHYGSQTLSFQCKLIDAYYLQSANDEAAAVKILREILVSARLNGFSAFAWWRHDIMSKLCHLALVHDIEIEFVRGLIRQYDIPSPYLYDAEDDIWPWPLRVYSLGRFSVHLHDKLMTFSGKAQKRPLELLKALIAFGGRNVTEETLSEALWPEAEGDAAHSTFTTTLSRLRKLLGNEVLLFSDGKLSLNNALCWVDVWACERLLGQLERVAQKQIRVSNLDTLLKRLQDDYHGPFLPGEGQGWVLSLRERLKSRILRAINLLIRQEQDCNRSISLYEFALQIDDLGEQAYQGLMSCLGAQGRYAEALTVYGRCRNLIQAKFGIEPAEKTRQLAVAIQNGDKQTLTKVCIVCSQRH